MAYSHHTLPWIDSPFFETELANAGLNETDKAFVKSFADNGYAVIDPLIDNDTIDAIVDQLAPHFKKITNDSMRLQDAWRYNEKVKKLAASEAVYSKLRLLYRREPIPFQTLNFPVGTQQKTHSDMIHFNSVPGRFMCGVWTAFEDIKDDNGPLHYYPGSHKLPFYDMIDMGVKASDSHEMKRMIMVYGENYETFIEDMIKALGLSKATLNIKKGQSLIWAANLLHGGETITRTGASRHSQVTHYYFEDCLYYVPRLSDVAINKLYLSDLTNIKTGKKVTSTYFGEPVKPGTKLYVQQQTVKMLGKVSHLFPKPVVDKIKSIIR
jgi:ectoine hydroxylase-related dioxygenase (phytanoyl-CoA dioxygenase family)